MTKEDLIMAIVIATKELEVMTPSYWGDCTSSSPETIQYIDPQVLIHQLERMEENAN